MSLAEVAVSVVFVGGLIGAAWCIQGLYARLLVGIEGRAALAIESYFWWRDVGDDWETRHITIDTEDGSREIEVAPSGLGPMRQRALFWAGVWSLVSFGGRVSSGATWSFDPNPSVASGHK